MMNSVKKNESVNLKNKSNILSIVYVALFAAIISVCSLISIPIGSIPITLQFMGIFIASGFLGWYRGTLSVIIYILLGLIGVPVFAGGTSGFAKIISPTGGYIIGFIFMALIIDLAVKFFGRKLYVLVIAMILGAIVDYAFGTAWFMILYNSSPDKSIGLGGALMLCVVPYLPADAVKIAVSAVLVNRLHKYLKF